MRLDNIDEGQEFDWSKTTADYARYRDIYPSSFYEKLLFFGIGTSGQMVLDLGSGTGVLPRAMYGYGAHYYATDISQHQLDQGRRLAEEAGITIQWKQCAAEDTGYPDRFFDAVTAMSCWWYFDTRQVVPEIHRVLKPGGKLALGQMNWLSDISPIAKMSEDLVLSFNPKWKGIGINRTHLQIPSWLQQFFVVETLHTYDEELPFSHQTWNGRMKACRGVGASLTPEQVQEFHREHMNKLQTMTSSDFTIPHQIIIEIYRAL